MSHKRTEIEFVKAKAARYVTFSKRKYGLMKKASELSILCGAKIVVVGFTLGGKPFSFSSPNVQDVIDKYLGLQGASSKQVNKGKVSIILSSLDFEELKKLRDSLKKLRDGIEAASSLILLSKETM